MPTSTLTKFNQFTKDLIDGVHNFATHTFKAMLTNTAPLVTNSVKADLTEISAGNGYPAGGVTVSITTSTSGGIAKVTAADATITASGGSIGPFRYLSLYNDTPSSPADPLIGFYDYGSSISLNNGEPLDIDFDGNDGALTVQ